MPEAVLQQAASEMLDWHGSGMGVMEMSHRGKEFMAIAEQAEADLRALLAVPSHFKILFMQGGGLAENAIVPMNLARSNPAWKWTLWSRAAGARSRPRRRRNTARLTWRPAGPTAASPPCPLPPPGGCAGRQLCAPVQQRNHPRGRVSRTARPASPGLRCAFGHRLFVARAVAPGGLVARGPGLWRRTKNIGPAGVTLVVVREDLLGHALAICPSAFDYQTVADNASMYNTPPTYGIYMAGPHVPVAAGPARRASSRGVAAMERATSPKPSCCTTSSTTRSSTSTASPRPAARA
jgi:phosphoserine aminotransferase